MFEDDVADNEEVHDANALKRWDKFVAERRKLCNKLKSKHRLLSIRPSLLFYLLVYFSEKIRRPAEQMVMNSSDACYLKRTENEMIDQTLPCLSYGKGGSLEMLFILSLL